ncbi:hypothetical protein RWX45_07170, partial [Actinomyces sp. MRS3W]|nr:hypothetical protein [Actinomyces sp. MRS3W]
MSDPRHDRKPSAATTSRSRRLGRLRPRHLFSRSLRTRLVAGVIGIVLVMAAGIGAFSTLTLRHTLMNRLDEQLTA